MSVHRLPTWTLLVFPLLLLAALLGAASIPSQGEAPAQAAATRELHTAKQAYGPHPRQQLTAYWHDTEAPRAGIVIVPGGYWSELSNWPEWSRRFAAAGYAVFELNYRYNSDAAWPAQRTDALKALSTIRRTAGLYSLDPSRIVLLGSSAGGHIAAATGAYRDGRSEVAGVVALSPAASPYRAWLDGGRPDARKSQRTLREQAEVLAGCAPDRKDDRCWSTWESMTVKYDASGADDAPMLLLHSREDFVPPTHSYELAEAERARGMPARDITVRVTEGSEHGMGLLDDPYARSQVYDWIGRITETAAG